MKKLALLIAVLTFATASCAEINLYVTDHSTATITIEQDRTDVNTEATIPSLGAVM